MALPDGFQTVVGEGGATLSGGEKQRISIARCILKDAPIIILDEATASVDTDNESYIQEAISELVKGKTLLVIAHRLNTIQNAVVLIENDRLATALLRLSPKDREIFMMHWFLWMTDEQIAKCMGMARRTVNTRRYKAYRLLKKLMGGEADD